MDSPGQKFPAQKSPALLTIADPSDVETAVLLTVAGLAVTELALWGRRQQSRSSARKGLSRGAPAAAAALELLAAALAGPEPDDPSGPRWAQVRKHIEENLADPSLRPHHIAATHSMSVRGLYQLFERHGVTVSGYIRQRRPARARSDLARLGTATTVAATAPLGFVDQAAFSRAFRKRYGCPPDTVRLSRG